MIAFLWIRRLVTLYYFYYYYFAQSAGAVKYTDCFSAEA